MSPGSQDGAAFAGAASGVWLRCCPIPCLATLGSGLSQGKAAAGAARGVSLQLSLQPSETLFLDKTVSNERGNQERNIRGEAGCYLFACFLFEAAVPCVAGAAHSLPGLSSDPTGPLGRWGDPTEPLGRWGDPAGSLGRWGDPAATTVPLQAEATWAGAEAPSPCRLLFQPVH